MWRFRSAQGGQGLRIETHQVGNPGAKLSIWIDGSRERLFSRILTDGRLQVRGRRRAMPARFPPKRPRLSAFCLRLQTRQNGPCRGPERSRDADEPGSFVGRLRPQAWIGNVDDPDALAWLETVTRRRAANERSAPRPRDCCSNRTAARARSFAHGLRMASRTRAPTAGECGRPRTVTRLTSRQISGSTKGLATSPVMDDRACRHEGVTGAGRGHRQDPVVAIAPIDGPRMAVVLVEALSEDLARLRN